MLGGLTTKSQVLSFLHSKSGFSCKYLFLGYGVPAFNQHPMIYPSRGRPLTTLQIPRTPYPTKSYANLKVQNLKFLLQNNSFVNNLEYIVT